MSENTKHTPGPWEICRYGEIGLGVAGGGRSIAIVGKIQQDRLEHCNKARSTAAARGEPGQFANQEAQTLENMQAQIEADACLIAAAPDLLKALRSLTTGSVVARAKTGKTRTACILLVVLSQGKRSERRREDHEQDQTAPLPVLRGR